MPADHDLPRGGLHVRRGDGHDVGLRPEPGGMLDCYLARGEGLLALLEAELAARALVVV